MFEWRWRGLPGAHDKPRFHRRWSTPVVIIAWLVLIVPVALLMKYPTVLHVAVYTLMVFFLLIIYFFVRCVRRGDRVQNHRYVALFLLFVATAPEEVSLAMGGWFFGVGVSYDISGQIATLTTAHGGTGIGGYESVFQWLLIGGVVIAVIYLIAAPWIGKLMHGMR